MTGRTSRWSRRLTRRELFPRAAGGVASLGLAALLGYDLRASHAASAPVAPEVASVTPAAASTSVNLQTFQSRPDLHPPVVSVTNLDPASATASPRFILLSPRVDDPRAPGQGLMVLDRSGRLVWFQPVGGGDSDFNFNIGTYGGQTALTWWRGAVRAAHGDGVGQIADPSYRSLETIRAGHGLQTDLHELSLTARGTAYITAYDTVAADLSSFGGPRHGKVYVGHVQEVDLRTGRILFDWDSAEHVPFRESYQQIGPEPAWDYFHVNSVAELEDGNLLISARNTSALYKVDRSTGAIIWRLNGKRSDFALAPRARFHWQHHARWHGTSTITLFDNAVSYEKRSRGLLLSVDTGAMHVTVEHEYVHPAGLDATAMGSVQLLPDGRVFVGWGDEPYFSEFAPDGRLLMDGQLPVGSRSYRAFVQDWVGLPTGQPQIVARADPAGQFVVYASWNGATEVVRWQVLAGADPSSLEPVGSQEWTGFETAIAVNASGPSFAAIALDSNGRELGRSAAV